MPLGPLGLEAFLQARDSWRRRGLRVVFTNGCFDILHAGHVRYLRRARLLGDRLVVGLNGDASVRRLKGEGRPVVPELERAEILAALECVDAVVLFHEDTPLRLIQAITPEVLVKGGDWPLEAIVGREHVESRGGRVRTLPLLTGRSTSKLIEAVRGNRDAAAPSGARGSESDTPT